MTEEEESYITDDMRAAIGRQSSPHPLDIERGAIRQYARAAGYTNPIYFDVEAAKAAGHPDLPAPPGFLGRHLFLPGVSDPTFSGPMEGSVLRNPRLKRNLNGGQSIRLKRRLYAGERITMTSALVNVTERTGSIGRMLISTTENTYRDEKGEIVATENFTGIAY
jgi:acyl dehydratase